MNLKDITGVFGFFLIAGRIRQPESPTACKFIFLNHDYKLKLIKYLFILSTYSYIILNANRGHLNFYTLPLLRTIFFFPIKSTYNEIFSNINLIICLFSLKISHLSVLFHHLPRTPHSRPHKLPLTSTHNAFPNQPLYRTYCRKSTQIGCSQGYCPE